MIIKIVSLLSASILFFSVGLFSIIPVEAESHDIIFWSESRSLTWDDFQGTDTTPESKSEALTNWSIYYKVKYKPIDSDVCKFKITVDGATFYKKDSYFNVGYKEHRQLKHEQGHFDVGEIFHRVLKQDLKNKEFLCPNGVFDNSVFPIGQAFLAGYITKAKTMNNQYDAEATSLGVDLMRFEPAELIHMQYQWDAKIKCMLRESIDYCSSINFEEYKTANPPNYTPGKYFDYSGAWYFTMGAELSEQKKYEDALIFFEKGIEIDPNYSFLLHKIGLTNFHLGNYAEGISYFEKFLEINPMYISDLINIGMGYIELGNYNHALYYFEKVLEIEPENSTVTEVIKQIEEKRPGTTPEPPPGATLTLAPIPTPPPIPTPTPTPIPTPTPTPKLIEDPCPKPTVTGWLGGYLIVWVEDSLDGGKNAKGIKLGFEDWVDKLFSLGPVDFDDQMSNLQIDCDSKTLTVALEGSGTKSIIGELYVIKNSIKNPYKANLAAKSMSISVDGKDINDQIIKSTISSYTTEFSFVVSNRAKTITISNLSIIPDSLQKTESTVDSTPKVKEKVPGWIKNNAKWWSEGQIGDSDFVGGLQYLIKENIITVPRQTAISSAGSNEIPDWVKNNAGWWGNGIISEDEFLNSVQYLMKEGIIKV